MFLPIILIAAALCVTTAIVTSASRKKVRQRMLTTLASIPDFHATKYVMGCDTQSCVAFDEATSSLCLLTQNSATAAVQYQLVRDSQIVSVWLYEDGNLIARVARSSRRNGASMDALPPDGLGTISAAPMSKARKSSEVNQIELKLVVQGTHAGSYDVRLLDTDCSRDSPLYLGALRVALGWVGIVEALIGRAERDGTVAPIKAPQRAATVTVADEVEKLSQLMGTGALTRNEFETARDRLLGADNPMATAPRLRSA